MKDISNDLVGRMLEDNWKVVSRIKLKNTSGGNFSVSYNVARDSKGEIQHAFLKALNLARAFRTSDFMKELQKLTSTHNFERELLEICSDGKLTKIVRILDHGEVLYVDDGIEEEFYPVPYLIFESADGSVRDKLNDSKSFEALWILRSLHSITIGLKQLHYKGIAHQDLKPSNVLVFGKESESKLADLGRSDMKGRAAPHSTFAIAGDPSYAPPELLYNLVHADWNYRRIACDLYHLGSMIFFYFTQTHATDQIRINLPPQYHWNNWKGDYSQVLPYLIDALELGLDDLRTELVAAYHDEMIVEELISCTRQLCTPDVTKRGHPTNRQRIENPLSLERYISIFDRLVRRYELIKLRE